MNIELGDKPEPTAEEPQLHPGGVDSLADEEKYGQWLDEPTAPDLPPEANPAVEDEAPDEISQPDDKKQEPDDDGEDAEPDTERSPSAGQEDERGEPEEPA